MTDTAITPAVVAADLRAAAAALRTHGWTRGEFWSRDTGCLCLVGAIKTGVHGTVPIGVGLAGKPRWLPNEIFRPDESARADAAQNAVTWYIRRHDLIEPDPDPSPECNCDAVDWNDNHCPSAGEAIQLLLDAAAELDTFTEAGVS